MYEGRSLVPQLPIPVALPDFSRTHAPSVSEIFPEPKPVDVRSFGQKLMEIRSRMLNDGASAEEVAHCEKLLFTYSTLEQEIIAFLASARQAHLERLEAKRGELWAACRRLEDSALAASNEVAALQNSLNNQAHVVSEWRAKVQEAAAPPFATRFPNQAEVQTWNGRLEGARAELAKAIGGQQKTDSTLRAARIEHEEIARSLARKVDELRAADSELIGYRQTT
jgi:hypothetical protein